MRPDLHGEELPVFHLVQVPPLLLSQLHAGLVMAEGVLGCVQLQVEQAPLFVFLILLDRCLFHPFEVPHGTAKV